LTFHNEYEALCSCGAHYRKENSVVFSVSSGHM
jgi:hypothetical protein